MTKALLNVLDLFRYDTLLMTVDAVRRTEALWDAAQEDSEAA